MATDIKGARIEKVTSEEDAWALLRQALENVDQQHERTLVDFDGWPNVDVYLPETPVDASISPTMMEAFLKLQESVYRAHKFVETDSGNLRLLLNKEREDLEFRVKVTPGSSGYQVDLTSVMNRIGIEALSKMDSAHILIAILGVAVTIGATSVMRKWIAERSAMRQAELENEEKKAYLESRSQVSSEDTERYRLLLAAQQRLPVLGDIEASVDTARASMVRAISEERGGQFMGTTIEKEFGAELTANKRQNSEEIRLAGYFRVDKVDTTLADGFRVTLTDPQNSTTIVAAMQDHLISIGHKRVVSEAEWNKTNVYVEMTAKRLRNRIVDATILTASQHQPQD